MGSVLGRSLDKAPRMSGSTLGTPFSGNCQYTSQSELLEPGYIGNYIGGGGGFRDY